MVSRKESNETNVIVAVLAVLVAILFCAGGVLFISQWRRNIASQLVAEALRAEADAEHAQQFALQLKSTEIAEVAVEEDVASTASRPSEKETDTAIAIREILVSQQGAWNAGDIPKFMQHYWKSDQLSFSSGGTTTRSWQKTLENYQRKYPTSDAMGELTFSNLEVTELGDLAALVLGDWHLERKTDDLGGNFSLVFRREGGKWVIIHDHSSRRPEKND